MLVYDAILVTVPFAFGLSMTISWLLGITYTLPLAIAAIISLLPIIYGLFIEPPMNNTSHAKRRVAE